MSLKTTSILLSLLLLLSIQAGAAAKAEPKWTHTMIDSVVMKTQNEMRCEMIVAMSLDRSEVRVMRADPPDKTYNMTYFSNNPEYFAKYGKSYQVADLIDTKGVKVKTIQASINFEDNRRDLTLVIHLANGSKAEKVLSLDADFFRDHAKHCLK